MVNIGRKTLQRLIMIIVVDTIDGPIATADTGVNNPEWARRATSTDPEAAHSQRRIPASTILNGPTKAEVSTFMNGPTVATE
jgi:hypothetical protein